MSKQTQITLLIGLLAVLGVVVYIEYGGRAPAPVPPVAASGQVNYQPLSVENPSLRLDMLERIRKFEYSGRHRNIFSHSAPPPETPKPDPRKQPPGPVQPPGPPPLEVPVKFFGYATDPATGRRRAFFTNGEDVYITAEGEVLLGRFRLLRINTATAEVEEVGSARRATLPIEEPVAPGGGG